MSSRLLKTNKNSSGDELANVNFFTTISHTYFKIPITVGSNPRNYREVTAVAREFPHGQNYAGWTKRSSLIHTDGPEWSSARKRIRPTTVLDVCK